MIEKYFSDTIPICVSLIWKNIFLKKFTGKFTTKCYGKCKFRTKKGVSHFVFFKWTIQVIKNVILIFLNIPLRKTIKKNQITREIYVEFLALRT